MLIELTKGSIIMIIKLEKKIFLKFIVSQKIKIAEKEAKPNKSNHLTIPLMIKFKS